MDEGPPPRAGTAIRPLPRGARFVLRAAPDAAETVSAAFGLALPTEMLRATAAGTRAALRLGPDEWLLLAEPEAQIACDAAAVSLVDVSHGRAAIEVVGPAAAELLNEYCPLDLSDPAFPPGACTRTVFGKAEVTLWRPDATPRFWVEAARSFAPYVTALLEEAARDVD